MELRNTQDVATRDLNYNRDYLTKLKIPLDENIKIPVALELSKLQN